METAKVIYDRIAYLESRLGRLSDGIDNPELDAMLGELGKLNSLYLDKHSVIGKSGHLNVVPIQRLSLSLNLRDMSPAKAALHVSQCKKAARLLYATCHPDKGGDAAEFDLIRKAERALDLDFLYLKLYDKNGVTATDSKLLISRLKARESQLLGSSVGRLIKLKESNSPDFLAEFISYLRFQLLSMSTNLMRSSL